MRFLSITNQPSSFPALTQLGLPDPNGGGGYNTVSLEFISEFVQQTMFALELAEDVFRRFELMRTDDPEQGSLTMGFTIEVPQADPRTPREIAEQLREAIRNPSSRWYLRPGPLTLFIDPGFFQFSLLGWALGFLQDLALWQVRPTSPSAGRLWRA